MIEVTAACARCEQARYVQVAWLVRHRNKLRQLRLGRCDLDLNEYVVVARFAAVQALPEGRARAGVAAPRVGAALDIGRAAARTGYATHKTFHNRRT